MSAGPTVQLPNGLRLHTRNRYEANVLYHEMFVARSYFRHGITLSSGDLVLDVGANIGMFGALLAADFPGVTVHMLEPVAGTFTTLERNAVLFRERITVHLHRLALGKSSGRAEFSVDPGASFAATMKPEDVEASIDATASRDAWAQAFLDDMPRVFPGRFGQLVGAAMKSRVLRPVALRVTGAALVANARARKRRSVTENCDVMRLSDFLSATTIDRIDLLKIDVEGSEMDVLQGIDDSDWNRVRQIVVEVHDVDGRALKIQEMLRLRGFATTSEPEDWAIHQLMGLTTVFGRRSERP